MKRVAARQRPQRLPALVLAEAHVTLRSLRVDAVRGPSIARGAARVGAAGAIGVAGGARGKRVNLLPRRRPLAAVAEHPRAAVSRALQPGVKLAEHRRHRLGEEGDAGSKRLGRRRAGFVHVVPSRAIRGRIRGIVRGVGAAVVQSVDAELARHALDRVAERVAGRSRPGARTGRRNASGGGGGGDAAAAKTRGGMRANLRVVVVVKIVGWPIGRVPRAIGRRGIGRVALGAGERERAGGGGARRRRGGRRSAAPHVVVHPRQRGESGPGPLGRGGRLLLPRAGRRRGDREEAGDACGNPRGSAVGPAACDRQRVARRRGRVPASVHAR